MPTPRDPDLFLKPLADAFFNCTANDGPESTSVRNAHFFYAAKFASIARLIELARIIPKFVKNSQPPQTPKKTLQENQLLYGFFTNTVSAVESFCFAAYFLGTALEKLEFDPEPKLREIDPERTLSCFSVLDSNSPFTQALRRCIRSQEYKTTTAIRNMLSHRITPGRTYRPMVSLQLWNLDQWHEGDWSRAIPGGPQEEFQIETKSLIDLRNWVDKQLELLGEQLQNLAVSKGLRLRLSPV
jgi:hypothetical protein